MLIPRTLSGVSHDVVRRLPRSRRLQRGCSGVGPAKITESDAGGVTGFSSGIGPKSSEVDFLGFPPAFLSRAHGTG
ncbi:hypothetical protein NDU88_009157 [Pleurodeles waltl]|uniref:Uncharacterized protein n=1 Tax=Pleurodeles waltl TaxID=8319 RepID=A0AAV7PV41_PLEWA|nr:hypothetical protein NDU88_009157 [Pleurodeles waltl]